MRLLSVNVAKPREIIVGGTSHMTSIYKQPVSGPVMLTKLDVDGNAQADLKNHGGVDKAAYIYPFEHYDFWSQELNRDDLSFGQFGENFTTEGLLETDIHVNDTFKLGSTAIVQVTTPRIPCFKFEHKMGIPGFVKQFQQAERSGFYLRVLTEGPVEANDIFELIERDDNQITIHELYHLFFHWRDHKDHVQELINANAFPGWYQDWFVRRMTL